MFQVITIEDPNGADYTSLVDQGMHFGGLDEFKNVIAEKLGIKLSEISITEV